MRLVALFLKALIRGYQLAISPVIGGHMHCRFQPSCSHYAHEAISTHGAIRGLRLTVSRLARCRPGGHSGYDPVPMTTETTH